MIELETEIDDAILNDARLLAVVEQATKMLGEVVQNTDDPVSAYWQLLATDPKKPMVRLKVTQGEWSKTTEFPRDGLLAMTESALDLRLIRLWGDVLEVKSHAQSRRLRESIEAMIAVDEAGR